MEAVAEDAVQSPSPEPIAEARLLRQFFGWAELLALGVGVYLLSLYANLRSPSALISVVVAWGVAWPVLHQARRLAARGRTEPAIWISAALF